MILSIAVLAFTTAQRLGELILSNRNTSRLRQRGGYEVGARHYPLLIAVHVSWLIGLWLLGWNRPVNLAWLAVFAVLQAARLWIVATLGERWTTRIIVVPGEPLVRRGPYRFLRHPNYMVVAGEVMVLPLAFALAGYGAVFSVLNLAMLIVRVRAEDAALKATAPP
jgi:methyltransferase